MIVVRNPLLIYFVEIFNRIVFLKKPFSFATDYKQRTTYIIEKPPCPNIGGRILKPDLPFNLPSIIASLA